MNKTQLPSNFSKHTSNNPIQKLLINNFYNTLLQLVKPLEVRRVLDTGCGEGFSLNKLSEEKIAASLQGIDNSKEAISLGKKLFPNLKLQLGSIYELPYEDDYFDLVLCTEVLEHVDNPQKALHELMRVSGKYLLISVPNEPFFMISNFLRGKNISRWGNDPGHINHWTIFAFKEFLKKNGLKNVTIKLPFPWTMVLLEKY